MVNLQLSTYELAKLSDVIIRARRIVVFTGAGVSAESGIPTFRDAQTGLWAKFKAEHLATANAFRQDPALVWGWYEWRRMLVMQAQPNAAHRSIAMLASYVPRLTVITQNVDDLHERAGSKDVIHLHGSLFKPRCFACARQHASGVDIPNQPDAGQRVEPPRCIHCNGRIRPSVVWFGEQLPAVEWNAAMAAVTRNACDVFISIGTSSVVYPAAELPFEARSNGAIVIQINLAPTESDMYAHYNLYGPAGEILPQLLNTAWGSQDF